LVKLGAQTLGGVSDRLMILFEYLAIAFSLVFSFSGMRLVSGLPHAVRPGRRYWVHLCFLFWQLLTTVGIFWAFWSFRTVSWNFLTFLLVLASPGLIYYNACTLVPENPSTVESWRDHYYSIRNRYFVGVTCWIVVVAIISTVVLDMPLFHPARGGQVAVLVAGVAGVAFPNHRVQASIAVFVLAVSVVLLFTSGFRPGSFAPP
jgi:hypothetical protein